MKANELSCKDLIVGDWVIPHIFDSKLEPSRIVGIHYNSYKGKDYMDWVDCEVWDELNMDEIEPIPLTAEILEKNFEGKSNIFGLQTYILDENFSLEDRGSKLCLVRTCNDYIGSKFWVCDIMYVHQLQHALKLFNIEKEIEL